MLVSISTPPPKKKIAIKSVLMTGVISGVATLKDKIRQISEMTIGEINSLLELL